VIEPGGTSPAAWKVPTSPMMLPMVQVTAARPSIVNPPLGGGGGAAAITITVAVPKTVPLVATTVLLNVAVVPPAVKRPVPSLFRGKIPLLVTWPPITSCGRALTLVHAISLTYHLNG
jgi:hypothetical protein